MVEKYTEQYDGWIYGSNKRHTELLKMMEKEETWCKLPFTRERVEVETDDQLEFARGFWGIIEVLGDRRDVRKQMNRWIQWGKVTKAIYGGSEGGMWREACDAEEQEVFKVRD